MKLVRLHDNSFVARTSFGTMPLPQVFRAAKAISWRTAEEIEQATGLKHPDLDCINYGIAPTTHDLLVAFDHLGYEITLTRKRP